MPSTLSTIAAPKRVNRNSGELILKIISSVKKEPFDPVRCPNYGVKCSLNNALPGLPVIPVKTPGECGRFIIFFNYDNVVNCMHKTLLNISHFRTVLPDLSQQM